MIKYVKKANLWCVTKKEYNANTKKEVFRQLWCDTKEGAKLKDKEDSNVDK